MSSGDKPKGLHEMYNDFLKTYTTSEYQDLLSNLSGFTSISAEATSGAGGYTIGAGTTSNGANITWVDNTSGGYVYPSNGGLTPNNPSWPSQIAPGWQPSPQQPTVNPFPYPFSNSPSPKIDPIDLLMNLNMERIAEILKGLSPAKLAAFLENLDDIRALAQKAAVNNL